MTLEEILVELQKWGKPRLVVCDKENKYWHCSLDLNIKMPGGTYEIQTEHHEHMTPMSAARFVLRCLKETMGSLQSEMARIGQVPDA